MPPRLEFQAIAKQFAGVSALRDVTLVLEAGRVLGLVGENGAGKSTLMNVLGGLVRPDAGTMRLDGETYAPASAVDAARAGIACIHQELSLFPGLSIADNLFLGGYAMAGPFISWRRTRAHARRLLQEVGLDVAPETIVDRLSPGERQLVEIAKALRSRASLIVFDEPTTSLTTPEAERLFALIARLRARGTAIVFISHALGDVLALADRIAVLRDGEIVAEGDASDFTAEGLIAKMIGRPLDQLFPTRTSSPSADPVLHVRAVTEPGTLQRVSLTVHRGEILGLFGLMGSGRSELARVLFGLDRAREGEVLLEGAPVHHLTPRERIQRGLAFVTEDRRADGLLLDASVRDNVALATLPRFASRSGVVDTARVRGVVTEIGRTLSLRTSSIDAQPVGRLSGGNQQKVVLAKWLLTEPRVLLLDEPTRGIDVGTRYEVYALVHRLAERGVGILCISSELEELLGLCDRILVMRQGGICGEFAGGAIDREAVLRAAFGESADPGSTSPAAASA